MKWAISILMILLSFNTSLANSDKDSLRSENDSLCWMENQIDQVSEKCMGVVYKWGGESMTGFDCSGFVRYVFKQVQIDLPHSSKAIAKMGKEVKLSEAQKGDIIIFTGYKDRKNVGHVGIILHNEPDKLIFIHSSSAPKNKGVVKTNYHQSNYPNRFIKVIRIS